MGVVAVLATSGQDRSVGEFGIRHQVLRVMAFGAGVGNPVGPEQVVPLAGVGVVAIIAVTGGKRLMKVDGLIRGGRQVVVAIRAKGQLVGNRCGTLVAGGAVPFLERGMALGVQQARLS